MRILLTISVLFTFIMAYAQPNVMISEIADPNDNENCRFVEIICKGAAPCNMSGLELQRWTNGNTNPTTSSNISLGSLGTMQPNQIAVIANNSSSFNGCYGFNPDIGANTGGPADSNGDDQIAIVDGSGNIIDIFGVPGEDGTGTCHEFEDGRAVRNVTATQAQTTWVEAEWDMFSDSAPSGGTTCPNQTVGAQNVSDMNPGESVLPVDLTAFDVTLRNGKAQLEWATATEKNNAGFEIERSADGQSYQQLGFERGSGDSNEAVEYSYTDYSPLAGISYYRLKQVDLDGAYEYSPLVSIQNRTGSISVSPSSTSTYVTVSTSTDADGTVYMYNSVGMLMQKTTTVNGMAQLDLATMQSGIYFVQIEVDGQVMTEKVVRD